jgi:serine protease DegS
LRVTGVFPRGPAQQAGIREGDIVLSVNQVAADNASTITEIIAGSQQGQEIQLEVMRERQRFRATAIAGDLPDPSI